MKKFVALLLAVLMIGGVFAGCTEGDGETTSTEPTPEAKGEGVMTHAEYMAAPLDTEVTIEAYVQATQSWWDNQIIVYAQDQDGGYFLYNMACSEEDSAKLVPGTKIKVTGYKTEYNGEVEIIDSSFEILEGTWTATPIDLTSKLGTDEILAHQNELASFTDMTVEAISYKNDTPGDDIYLTLSKDGVSYAFCVEVYLTGTESDVYTTVGTLAVGDVVDVECFIYWWNAMEPHITAISK